MAKGYTLEELQKMGAKPVQTGYTLQQLQGMNDKVQPQKKSGNFAEDFSTGLAKGVLSTAKGLGTIGQSVLDQTAGRFVNLAQGQGFTPTSAPTGEFSDIYKKGSGLEKKATDLLAPKNTGELVGKTTEQIAEFFIPAGAASKAEKTINVLSKGIKTPILAAGTRIIGKSAVQGTAAGLVTAAQTGGDLKKTAVSAGTAGAIRGGFATIGEGARALKLPERLYSTIFKNSKADMLAELRSDALENLAKTNPSKYQEFVKKGLVKVKEGRPILNETVAEKALNRGLRGSLKNMSNEVVTKALDSEDEIQTLVRNYQKPINITEPQYVKVLKSVAADYEDVGFGEIAQQADDLANRISSAKGMVDAQTALEARRFFDRMRLASSFDKPASSLSMTQSNFKTLADTLRSRLSEIPGVKPVMGNYSFYIDALEALAQEAARKGNNQIIGMIDSIFLGGAAASVNPVAPISVGAIRKFLSTTSGKTFLAQYLNNPNLGTTGSGLLGISGGAASAVTPEE